MNEKPCVPFSLLGSTFQCDLGKKCIVSDKIGKKMEQRKRERGCVYVFMSFSSGVTES